MKVLNDQDKKSPHLSFINHPICFTPMDVFEWVKWWSLIFEAHSMGEPTYENAS